MSGIGYQPGELDHWIATRNWARMNGHAGIYDAAESVCRMLGVGELA